MCVQVLQMSLAERGKGEIYQVFAFKFRYSSLFIRLPTQDHPSYRAKFQTHFIKLLNNTKLSPLENPPFLQSYFYITEGWSYKNGAIVSKNVNVIYPGSTITYNSKIAFHSILI